MRKRKIHRLPCSSRTASPRTALLAAAAAVLLPPSLAQAREGLHFARGRDVLTVLEGDRPIVGYRLAPTPYKPYVETFFTPGGVNVLRDSPPDHKHHHGLMFAIAIDGLNFWEEHDAPGKQAVRDTKTLEGTASGKLRRLSFTQALDWIDPRTKRIFAREARKITVFRAPDVRASVMTWETRLSVPEGRTSATLSGHRYFGLGARFLPSMDHDGRFFNADGKTGVEGTNLVPSSWCAYSAMADGKPVTIAMFDAPDNPRHPATWFTMGDKPNEFAYLSATMHLKQDPMTISAGHPLRVHYGIALWDGWIGQADVDALYRRWLAW